MRQTYLTSDNPTVVNRLRKDCREYARQRELEEWFEHPPCPSGVEGGRGWQANRRRS